MKRFFILNFPNKFLLLFINIISQTRYVQKRVAKYLRRRRDYLYVQSQRAVYFICQVHYVCKYASQHIFAALQGIWNRCRERPIIMNIHKLKIRGEIKIHLATS